MGLIDEIGKRRFDFSKSGFLGVLLIFSLIGLPALGQTPNAFDSTEISQDLEMDLINSNKRGIKDGSEAIYYIEKDFMTLTAYHNGNKKWGFDIIEKFGKPAIGNAKIRHIKLDNNRIIVTYGKHSFVSVDIDTGKATFLGSD